MSLRDYGLPKSTPAGTPTWEPLEEGAPTCPNCGGKVCRVQVRVKMELLSGGVGLSTYLGCPACPWASPAVAMSDKSRSVVSDPSVG